MRHSFAGIGEAQPFSLPKEKALLKKQVLSNLDFFATNYLLLAVLIAVGMLLYRPFLLVFAVVLGGGLRHTILFAKPQQAGSFTITAEHQSLAVVAVTVMFYLYYCLWTTFLILVTSVVVILLHSAVRETAVREEYAAKLGPGVA